MKTVIKDVDELAHRHGIDVENKSPPTDKTHRGGIDAPDYECLRCKIIANSGKIFLLNQKNRC
jgi:hypothetical protein